MPSATTKTTEEKIYWSTNQKLRLAGLEPEIRSLQGNRPDKSLCFHNHIYRTSDPKEQKHIEKSKLFGQKNGIEIVTEEEIQRRRERAAIEKKRALQAQMDRMKV